MIEAFSNGIKFDYWTSVSVSRSLGRIAASFRMNLTNHDAQGGRVKLFSGDLIEVDIDGIGALKGFVGPLSLSLDERGGNFSVSGHEMTCDLVDCCTTRQMEWLDKDAGQIISDLCDEFGLKFYNPQNVDLGISIKKFSVDPGTRAVDAISKICRQRGILPCSNGMGKVYVVKPSGCPRGPAIVEGENIVGIRADYNANALYSDYYVYGTGKADKKIVAHRQDPSVRNRPLVIIDSDAVDKDSVEARAAWEMSIRRAQSISYQVSLKGWKRDKQNLWEPGLICTLESPSVLVDDPVDMIESEVDYSWSNSGEDVELTLAPVDSYEPEPETEKPQKVISPKAKSVNVWEQIKRTVQS